MPVSVADQPALSNSCFLPTHSLTLSRGTLSTWDPDFPPVGPGAWTELQLRCAVWFPLNAMNTLGQEGDGGEWLWLSVLSCALDWRRCLHITQLSLSHLNVPEPPG